MDQIILAALTVVLLIVLAVARSVWAGRAAQDDARRGRATPEDEGRWLRD